MSSTEYMKEDFSLPNSSRITICDVMFSFILREQNISGKKKSDC